MAAAPRVGLVRGFEAAQRSSPPPSTRPFPPASLASFPVEITTHIFENLSSTSYNERAAALASLCLVNCHFLGIARPLLYQHIRLSLAQPYQLSRHKESNKRRTSGPLPTLLETKIGSKLVKSLSIVFAGAKRSDMITFAYVLSCLGSIEDIKAVRGQIVDRRLLQDFFEAILRHCPKIKHLRLPLIDDLDLRINITSLYSSFPALTSYDGLLQLVSSRRSSDQQPPSFRLRHLVSTSALDHGSLEWITRNSLDSLTSLSFALDEDAQWSISDLGRYRCLNTLGISLTSCSLPMGSDWSINDHLPVQTLLDLVSSLRTLPIRTFYLLINFSRAKAIGMGKRLDKERELFERSRGASWTRELSAELPMDMVLYATKDSLPFGTSTIRADTVPGTACKELLEEGSKIAGTLGLVQIRAVREHGLKVGVSYYNVGVLPLFECDGQEFDSGGQDGVVEGELMI